MTSKDLVKDFTHIFEVLSILPRPIAEGQAEMQRDLATALYCEGPRTERFNILVLDALTSYWVEPENAVRDIIFKITDISNPADMEGVEVTIEGYDIVASPVQHGDIKTLKIELNPDFWEFEKDNRKMKE